jgi:hypothetical protein
MCGKLRGRMATVMLVGMMLGIARVFLAAQEPPEQEGEACCPSAGGTKADTLAGGH